MSEATASTPAAGDGHDRATDWSDPDAPTPGIAPTAIESLVNAFLEAGPDVAEHIVRSAQELLLAAQTVVDAAQRAVEEQQSLRRPAEAPGGDPAAPAADAEASATVHRLDVGE